MEVASQEEHDMPIPINTTHGGHGHMIHRHHDHRHHNPANSTHPNPLIVLSNGNGFRQNHDDPDHHNVGYNIMISNNNVVNKYKGIPTFPYHHNQPQRNPMFHHHHKMTRSPLPQQMIMPLGVATTTVSNSESEEDIPFQHHRRTITVDIIKLRTKFTQEQKEDAEFCGRIGWKMQRQEESVVQKFCQEIGVRREFLKSGFITTNTIYPRRAIITMSRFLLVTTTSIKLLLEIVLLVLN
ncbi:hypothetical protein Bca52824_054619 [Brassica carinata]|uniref:Uncharacterized protein n=1 Tax=Brassica carinata TaxID=52824 RepID=A0A8X7R6G4_BRACI|nr:hypothetical protein Bca52824_054619 [Brassica carinata]